MQRFFQPVHISELFEGATKRAFGVSPPVGQDMAVPCPAFEPMAFADGEVTVTSVAGSSRADVLPRPLRVVRAVWGKLLRHPVGEPCADDDGLRFRAACLRDFLGPVKRALADTPELAPFIAAHAASFGRGAVAMPSAEVVNFLVTNGIEREEAERAARDVEEYGAVYEYDVIGRAYVESVKERAEAEARAAEEARVRAAAEKAPSDQSIDALGWACITRDTRVAQSDGRGLQRMATLHPAYEKEAEKIKREVHDAAIVGALTAHLVAGPYAYTFIPRVAFLGIDLDEVPLPFGVAFEKPGFVPPVARGELQKLQARVGAAFFAPSGEPQEKSLIPVRWLLELRARDAEVTEGTHDETTEEGRHRVELFEAFLAGPGAIYAPSKDDARSARAPSAPFATGMRLLFDVGHVALGLADDVTADVLQRWIMKRTRKVAPAWAMTRETLLAEARRMRGKQRAPIFIADDFYTHEEPGILERASNAIFGGDPWRSTIAAVVEGKDLLTNEAIVDGLRAVGVEEEELGSSKRDKRITHIMTALGFEKKQKRIDPNAAPRRVWVRTP